MRAAAAARGVLSDEGMGVRAVRVTMWDGSPDTKFGGGLNWVRVHGERPDLVWILRDRCESVQLQSTRRFF